MDKRLKEIFQRKFEIRATLESATEEQLQTFQVELETLETEERALLAKKEIADKINRGIVFPQNSIEKPGQNEESELQYRKAFMNYVLKGEAIPAEVRADANTVLADVGAVIPTTVLNKIVEKLANAGMILPLVTRTAYKGGLSIPTSAVKPVATWVAEGAGSDKQKKATGQVTFAYHKLRCAVSCSLEVDTMAISAFESALIQNISEAMVKAIEQAIISGTGTGQPKGVLKETPATGQAITATPSYASLCEAEGALPQTYENGAVWVMTKKSFMQIVALVDADGQPIGRINYGIGSVPERFILGRKVVLCDYLPSFAAGLTVGEVWAFLFNFEDYVLNTNYTMGVKKYEDNETDDIVTKAIMLIDGKVLDTGSLVTLKK